MWLSGKTLQSLHFLRRNNTFTNKGDSGTYKIREGLHLDCNSENVIYLITCRKCKKLYVGNCITGFCTRFNNYHSCHRRFCRGHSVIQVSFHTHFMLDGHCGINDWEIILIDKGYDKKETRKKELFWQYKLNTFVPMSK